MRKFLGWLRLRERRRWALAALGGIAISGLVLYLFPGGNQGTVLELMALGADGRFATSITIPPHWAQEGGLEPGAVIRVPLILSVRNIGKEAAPPTRLELSLPTRYRLSRGDGRPLPSEYVPGTPLIRYSIGVPAMRGTAGSIAGYQPVLDTIWLEPIIPSFHCIALSDSVPDFVPSPPAPVEAIARVRIFYSFSSEELEQRQTGLLAVQLDSKLLKLETPAPPPVFPTEYYDPQAPRPGVTELYYRGSRRSFCGEPQDPIEILSTLWETPEGGRFFVLDYGGAPRKYLFDLNRDSIIELELWDASGSGKFDARRRARLPIPSFLMPPAEIAPMDGSILASLTPEQLLALDRYGRTLAKPYQYKTRLPEAKPRTSRFRPGVIGSEEPGERRGVTYQYWSDPAGTVATGAGVTPIMPGHGQQPPGGVPSAPAISPSGPPSGNQTAPAPGARVAPPVAGPPILGRPIGPPATQPGRAPVTPQERTPATPRRGGAEPGTKPPAPTTRPPAPTQRPSDPEAKPAEPQRQGRPTDTPKPTQDRPAKPPPKVLGKPLDSIPPPARPGETGTRQ